MFSNDTPTATIAIKILLEPGLAGSIIGKGGAAITGLTEISGARIKISGMNDCYPGTTDQVLLISGGEDEVDSAQELIWHRIAQHLVWKTRGSIGIDTWDPRATLDAIRRGDISRGSHVTGRILIPLDASGAVIGTNGSFIRNMSDETGVRIQLAAKDDAVSLATQERVVTLVGEVEDCIQCTANIIKKMQEDSGVTYENKTPSYALYQSYAHQPNGSSDNHTRGGSKPSQAVSSNSNISSVGMMGSSFIPRLPTGLSVVSAVTTLTLSVSDAYAGQIIGKKGAVISDIQSKSGASMTISARDTGDGDWENGQGKRTLLIVGSPDEAQTALRLMVQRLGAGESASPEISIPSSSSSRSSSYKRPSPPKGGSSKLAY